MVAEPGRNPVAPPDLAGDAPVADIFHPVVVGVFPLFGENAGLAAFYGVQCPLGERRYFHIPLQRKVRFDDGLAAVAATNRHRVVVDFIQVAARFQVGNNLLSGLEAIHSLVLMSGSVDNAGFVKDINFIETVAQADFKVVEIVCRGDFDHTGAELALHVVIGHHRDLSPHKRQENFCADQITVALIFRMYRYGGIAQHGFRAGRRHRNKATRFADHRIADMPEMPLVILMLDFNV